MQATVTMATCISRRAYEQTIRLISKHGNHGLNIWTEYRCENKVGLEGQICSECSCKAPKHKCQSEPKCNHGIVGGPYPPDSKLYGSKFYLKLISEGWKILEEDEIRAKAAVNIACMPRKKVQAEPVVQVEPVVTVSQPELLIEQGQPEPPVKQKRAYKKKTPEEKAAKAVKAIKSGKPVKLDILLPTPPAPQAEEIHYDPKFVESVAPPITISEFVTVKVKKMTIQGKPYYHDANSGKLYGVSVNGVGAYKGRYNAEEDTVDTTFPDSDVEV